MTTATQPTLAEEARALRELKAEASAAKKVHDAAKAAVAEAHQALMDRMELEQVSSIGTGGTLFVRAETIYGNVNDRQEFIKWAEVNDPGLLKVTERDELINTMARRHIDDGEPLPPGVGWYSKPYISQRAQAGKADD
jgi:predicted ATPase